MAIVIGNQKMKTERTQQNRSIGTRPSFVSDLYEVFLKFGISFENFIANFCKGSALFFSLELSFRLQNLIYIFLN